MITNQGDVWGTADGGLLLKNVTGWNPELGPVESRRTSRRSPSREITLARPI